MELDIWNVNWELNTTSTVWRCFLHCHRSPHKQQIHALSKCKDSIKMFQLRNESLQTYFCKSSTPCLSLNIQTSHVKGMSIPWDVNIAVIKLHCHVHPIATQQSKISNVYFCCRASRCDRVACGKLHKSRQRRQARPECANNTQYILDQLNQVISTAWIPLVHKYKKIAIRYVNPKVATFLRTFLW